VNLIHIGLAISALLNGILLMFVVGVVPFFLFLSVILNIGCAWYIKNLFGNYNEVNTDMQAILIMLQNLNIHYEEVYKMEMYYGDEILQELLAHTKQTSENILFYNQKYSFDEDFLFQEEDLEEESSDGPAQKEEE
tara:strand:- start:130 stop:537 length:408 start_codon:yes stop_codon:yes gene_type:complete